VLQDLPLLRRYVEAGTPLDMARENPVLESVFSLLATRIAEGRLIDSISGLTIPANEVAPLTASITSALDSVEVPPAVLSKHAGLSPLSMQRLLDHFRQSDDSGRFLVSPPESQDAAQTYASALSRIDTFLGGSFGPPGRQFQLAILIVAWMRGRPLATLISERIRYNQRSGRAAAVPPLIRQVMTDVEQYARFQAPKYLACYLDILRYHVTSAGGEAGDEDFPDVSMMLELGVSRTTEVSLMALGLSRTSTVALSEYIVPDELTPSEALAWLRERDLATLPLPALVRREIAERLAAAAISSPAQPAAG
jgi:hypothetical protein